MSEIRQENNDIKARIEEEALKLFDQISYSKTSVADIANAAGIGKGTIYLYFRTKEDILISITQHRFDELLINNKKSFEDTSISKGIRIFRFLKLWTEEIIAIKSLLFGSFEEINVRMVKDIIFKYNSYTPALEFMMQIICENKTEYNTEMTKIYLTEFFNILFGRIIYFLLEEDWDKLDIRELQEVVCTTAKVVLSYNFKDISWG